MAGETNPTHETEEDGLAALDLMQALLIRRTRTSRRLRHMVAEARAARSGGREFDMAAVTERLDAEEAVLLGQTTGVSTTSNNETFGTRITVMPLETTGGTPPKNSAA